jgi:hypothetical protein
MQFTFKRILPVFAGVLMLSMMLVGSAWAAGSPKVETKPPTAVTETSATLNGVVDPNGVSTKYYFEYGTTVGYGKKTAEVSVGSGTANLNESKAITGLTPDTTYHFRIVATNADGTAYGEGEVVYSSLGGGPEFKPVPAKKKFTSKSGATKLAFDNGTETLTCTASSATGEIASARTVGDVVTVFSGCKGSGSTKENCPVNTAGAKAGEIVTKPLSGELGTIKSGSGVGLRLKAEGKRYWFILESNTCIYTEFWGSVAAEVGGVGVKKTTHQLVLAVPGGKQAITEITLDSGELQKPELEISDGATGNMEANDELTFEEAVEIT